ncbi:aminodeoxychorismate lyase [Austwickia sp. TVS 96-490-7B]|uniref:aminodeoxychorismate lyase n=1 Tax=Austwickia sp. TVS 96-490-7B TaxID=2830843 RepID=UPI001C582FB6|nr:aminodeoxychorismate lyase [Austwickia sp. TVS 96-490-7B]
MGLELTPLALVAVRGRGVLAADEPVLYADDLGVTRGDGCFDTARVVTDDDGVARITGLAAHLDRLAASAAAMDIVSPTYDQWAELIGDLLTAWHTPGEAVLKMVLTRGRERHADGPTAYVTLTHRGRPGRDAVPFAAREGISVVTLSKGHPSDAYAAAPWLLGGVKTLSYAVNAAAQREAIRRGADDVLFVSTDGYCLDGPTSGLIVRHGERLRTTPTGATGLLPSVTVERIVTAARQDGLIAEDTLIPVADLLHADGIWLVSSGRGPAPVRILDGQPMPMAESWRQRMLGYAGF